MRVTRSQPRGYVLRHVCHVSCGQYGCPRDYGSNPVRRRGYVLLETVIATGLLIVGLAVIGEQIQDADGAIKQMQRKVRAVMLAELKLAELDMGVVELNSIDDTEEGDFGPRYPDFGWRIIVDVTGLDNVFALTLQVMHHYREGVWKPDDFDHEAAEVVFTTHSLRAVPVPFDLERDFGLPEEQLKDVSKQFAQLSIPGLDISSLNPRTLAGLDFEDFVRALPVLAEVFGFDVNQLTGILPPQLQSLLQESGIGDQGDGNSDNKNDNTDNNNGPTGDQNGTSGSGGP